MAIENGPSKWRNFASWSAIAAILYAAFILGMFAFHPAGVIGGLADADAIAVQILAWLFASAVVGFSKRNAPIGSRSVASFVIGSAVAITVFLSGIWAVGKFGGTAVVEEIGGSARIAAAIGGVWLLLGLMTAGVLACVRFMDAERAADLRRDGRGHAYSAGSMFTWGASLVVLALAGPGGLVPPATALAVVLALMAASTLLGLASWRHLDELMRSISLECGNWSLYLLLAIGGGWSILAHLGFTPAPTPIDWLSMFSALMLAASFIALGRRGLLAQQ